MEETEQQQQNSGNATTINACIDLNNCSLNTYKNILSLRTSGEKQRVLDKYLSARYQME